MPKIEVSLSIGFAGEGHEDVLDIDQEEWDACESDEQRDDLMHEYWKDWSNNYIDGGYELLDR